ncbi:MAG: hypothetical protein LUC93_01845 [Planctomycetaceae bacterium]|nr:hypothetical protein [Planctomycetaceae bacterium]
MDSLIKKVASLASIAGQRREPHFPADAVMHRIEALPADVLLDAGPSRLFLTMAVTASGAAAAVALIASVAWVDVHDPFLALQSLASVAEHLR